MNFRSLGARIGAAAIAAVLSCAAASLGETATAPTGSASPTAAPSITPAVAPSGPSDPCASLSSLVSRPTFGTAACVVKLGDLLIETGYTNGTTSGNGANSLVTYPQTSLRVGSGHDLEFDLNPQSIARLSGGPRIVGTTDATLGAKYQFGATNKLVYGVNVLYTLATGEGPFTGNGDGILLNANAGLTLSPALGLYATLGYNEQSAGTTSVPARYHDFQPSLGASLSLPEGFNFNFFLEGFNQSSTGTGRGGRFVYDAGFQKDVGSRVQLDVNYYNYGIQSGGHLHSIGFGAAYLIGS